MTRVRRVLRASDRALLVEEGGAEATMRLHAALVAAALPGVRELVPAARTVLVVFDPLAVSAAELRGRLLALEPAPEPRSAHRVVEIPVRYDGEDLAEVAAVLGVGEAELIARHAAATWRVAFAGFAPGFGYLMSDDPLFDVPRRSSPRTRIPAGSVALAGPYAGVYPRESPGGWQLIGSTDAVMWDLHRDPPALLRPGTEVRFTPVAELAPRLVQGDARPRVGAHAIEVVSPGVQLTVQDRGRPGHASLGVSASGAADRRALRAANEAVGNARDEAALELAGGGAVLAFRGPGVVAVAGADMEPTVRRADGTTLFADHAAPVGTRDGDQLHLAAARDGVRAVIAVRGGLDLTPVLGSASTDTLSGVRAPEAGMLRAGDMVPLRGPAAARLAVHPGGLPRDPLPRSGGRSTLRIALGPRDGWFTPAAIRALEEQDWTVTPRSDRVGIRLDGPVPLERAVPGELPSEATVAGAVQVPPDGQPVLFLADHPLTGGYPVIAAVIDADLDLAGQLPPGARVRFRVVDV